MKKRPSYWEKCGRGRYLVYSWSKDWNRYINTDMVESANEAKLIVKQYNRSRKHA